MPEGDRKLRTDELGRIAPEAYAASLRQKVVVVLDGLRSRHNVGSIFRTCDAFGVERLVLCGFTPCPPHHEIEKTALGATRSVPWEHAADAITALSRLKAEGYQTIAVELTERALPLKSLAYVLDGPVALVFGNELHGVSEAAVTAADACVMVPQRGSKHSLNVSVCAGVVLHAMLREAP
ncbi:MAG: RNA methyltransferase [Flavobacteriales bacterium]|nr:RNA methyltransferase [Flavobacteriales bacterium]